MAARRHRIAPVQVIGILLIALLLAATAVWRASGSPTPELLGPVHARIEVGAVPERVDTRPVAVKLAEAVLAAHLHMSAGDLPEGVTMTSPSVDVRVICAEGTCAALRGSTQSYTYASGKGAATRALGLLLHPEKVRRQAKIAGGR